MSLAAGAARGASVQLPLGQLAIVGLGVFCIANPERFFNSLAVGAHYLSNPPASNQGAAPSQPIIIHQSAPTADGSSRTTAFVVRLVVGAGVCWGTYAVLATVLPETAKELLPVNKRVFNQAITSLGKAVLNLKDTLMEQINALSQKQDDLSDKQDKTHTEVLDIKDNVQDVKGDLSAVQEALDLCQASLSESERRTSYIARGVQLLTRGVSTILPEDELLLNELARFNLSGEEFRGPAPLQQRRLQEVRDNLRRQASSGGSERSQDDTVPDSLASTPSTQPSLMLSSFDSPQQIHKNSSADNPENDHPIKSVPTPKEVENSVAGVRHLLRLHSVGEPRRTHV